MKTGLPLVVNFERVSANELAARFLASVKSFFT